VPANMMSVEMRQLALIGRVRQRTDAATRTSTEQGIKEDHTEHRRHLDHRGENKDKVSEEDTHDDHSRWLDDTTDPSGPTDSEWSAANWQPRVRSTEHATSAKGLPARGPVSSVQPHRVNHDGADSTVGEAGGHGGDSAGPSKKTRRGGKKKAAKKAKQADLDERWFGRKKAEVKEAVAAKASATDTQPLEDEEAAPPASVQHSQEWTAASERRANMQTCRQGQWGCVLGRKLR